MLCVHVHTAYNICSFLGRMPTAFLRSCKRFIFPKVEYILNMHHPVMVISKLLGLCTPQYMPIYLSINYIHVLIDELKVKQKF